MKTINIENQEEIENIINKCGYCMVGLIDTEGMPYVIPMNFVYHNHIIYLHSGPKGKKIDSLQQNPNVCITFCEGEELVYMNKEIACSYSMKSRSVICRGKVEPIEDLESKRKAFDIFMKHYTTNECRYSDVALKNVVIWKVPVDKLSARSFGLRPSEIKK